MDTPATSLAAHEFRAVFPFFLRVDRQLRVTEAGDAWDKVRPELLGTGLTESVDVVRPRIENVDFDAIVKKSGSPFHLRLRDDAMSFRAQVLARDSSAVLLLTPVVHTANDLARAGLSLSDLATHDPTGDLLVTVQSLRTSLADARELTARLRKRRRELSQAKKVAEEAQAQAEAAAEARFLFLAAMSHEIRTPLNGVLGMARLLTHTPLDREQQHLLGTLQQSGRTLLAIINDVLEFSRLDGGHVMLESSPFSPLAAAEAVGELLAPAAQDKGLELVVRLGRHADLRAMGDDNRFRQLLLNLVNNAIKFTRSGFVELRVHRTGDRLVCEVEDSGIGIADHLTEHLFDPFTQADAATNRRFGGTGLGLSICKRLAAAMGGRMSVDSELGVGSTFRFDIELPVVANPATPMLPELKVGIIEPRQRSRQAMQHHLDGVLGVADVCAAPDLQTLADRHPGVRFDVLFAPAEDLHGADALTDEVVAISNLGDSRHPVPAELSVVTRPCLPSAIRTCLLRAGQRSEEPTAPVQPVGFDVSGPPLRALLVEDNAVNQLVARLTLEAMGVEVEVTEDGAEGVQAALSGTHDVVFMDCQMPGMDGYEATRRIRARLGDALPIVAMTANAMPADRARCLAAGMNDYLPKPLEHAELERVLREVSNRRSAD